MMRKDNTQSGLTLIEIMVGILLLIVGGGILLVGMQTSIVHAQYLSELQVAVHAVRGRLEQLTSNSFETLETGPAFNGARASGQFEAVPELPGVGGLAIQIHVPSPDFLDLHVVACWTSRGRTIGEDVNCNGQLDVGEDANGDTWITSPAMVTTRVAR